MKAILALFLLGCLAIAGAANAADLPVHKAPPPIAAPSYDWTGFYVGLGVGMRSTRTDATVIGFLSPFAPTTLAAECARLAPLGGCVTGEPVNDTAFRFNPYIGLNWQVAPQWVVGVEADWGFASKTTTLNGMNYPVSLGLNRIGITALAADTFSIKTTWDASARGRVGYLVTPSVLLYASGGAAWLHVESTSSCSTNPVLPGACAPGGLAPAVITDATTKIGWTIGGGIEAMLWSNWLARAEYRYADFGTISNTDMHTGAGGLTVNYDLAVRTHTALFGVAYRLGGGSAVVASDMPVKAAVYKAPAPAVANSWNGVYVGVGVGMRSTQTDAIVTNWTAGGGGINNVAADCANLATRGGCVTGEPLNDTAFRFAPYIGVNWQIVPQWLIGLEADWGFAGKTTKLSSMFYPESSWISVSAADTFSVRTTWDASARGRLGYLVTPSFLLYATGGPAWLDVESTSSCHTTCAPGGFTPAVITDATTKAGWTIGGGIEAMLWSNWLARAEYRYADFGTISNTDMRTGAGGLSVSYDLAVKTHTALFGLARKLDWGGPVVAKY